MVGSSTNSRRISGKGKSVRFGANVEYTMPATTATGAAVAVGGYGQEQQQQPVFCFSMEDPRRQGGGEDEEGVQGAYGVLKRLDAAELSQEEQQALAAAPAANVSVMGPAAPSAVNREVDERDKGNIEGGSAGVTVPAGLKLWFPQSVGGQGVKVKQLVKTHLISKGKDKEAGQAGGLGKTTASGAAGAHTGGAAFEGSGSRLRTSTATPKQAAAEGRVQTAGAGPGHGSKTFSGGDASSGASSSLHGSVISRDSRGNREDEQPRAQHVAEHSSFSARPQQQQQQQVQTQHTGSEEEEKLKQQQQVGRPKQQRDQQQEKQLQQQGDAAAAAGGGNGVAKVPKRRFVPNVAARRRVMLLECPPDVVVTRRGGPGVPAAAAATKSGSAGSMAAGQVEGSSEDLSSRASNLGGYKRELYGSGNGATASDARGGHDYSSSSSSTCNGYVNNTQQQQKEQREEEHRQQEMQRQQQQQGGAVTGDAAGAAFISTNSSSITSAKCRGHEVAGRGSSTGHQAGESARNWQCATAAAGGGNGYDVGCGSSSEGSGDESELEEGSLSSGGEGNGYAGESEDEDDVSEKSDMSEIIDSEAEDEEGEDGGYRAAVPFFSRPDKAIKVELSEFGLLWTSLNGWITAATRDYLFGPAGGTLTIGGSSSIDSSSIQEAFVTAAAAGAGGASAGGAAGVEGGGVVSEGKEEEVPSLAETQARATMCELLCQVLPGVLESLGSPVSPALVSKQLSDVVRGFKISGPLPALRRRQWQVVLLVVMAGLAMQKLQGLRGCFSKMVPDKKLDALLAQLGCSRDRFEALLDLYERDV
jgi:hypothetical protein